MTTLVFAPETYADRMSRARRLMREHGHEALLLSVGSDLPYFTGYEAMPLERLTMAVIWGSSESGSQASRSSNRNAAPSRRSWDSLLRTWWAW